LQRTWVSIDPVSTNFCAVTLGSTLSKTNGGHLISNWRQACYP
jgi:hypothetical protein